MKLRNKNTGEIIDGGDYLNVYDDLDHQGKSWHYNSLAELNADWEDYVPPEPLIKDEKIRNVVRAFSEVVQENNHIFVIKHRSIGIVKFCIGSRFLTALPVSDETSDAIEDRTYYTIDELCGEEKE